MIVFGGRSHCPCMPLGPCAGHATQGKQAAMLCMSSDWPYAISLALFGIMALVLNLILYVLRLFV